MNQMDILRSGIVGKRIDCIAKEGSGYRMVLDDGSVVLLVSLMDKMPDRIQARVKVSRV